MFFQSKKRGAGTKDSHETNLKSVFICTEPVDCMLWPFVDGRGDVALTFYNNNNNNTFYFIIGEFKIVISRREKNLFI